MSHLNHLYQSVVRDVFPVSAGLAPRFCLLQLGDYGFYVEGQFIKRGNLFEDYELDSAEFLAYDLTESDLSNYLLVSSNAQVMEAETLVNVNGVLYGAVDIEFSQGLGLLVHLRQVRNEMLRLDQCIQTLIEDRIRKHAWNDEYRLVWHREVANAAQFAYTHSAQGGIMSLRGRIDGPFLNYSELLLIPNLPACENMNIAGWSISPTSCTPLVSLVRYCQESPLGRGEDCVEGYEELEIIECENFVLDNSNSSL